MAIEIVDFPIKNGGKMAIEMIYPMKKCYFPSFFVCLPEGIIFTRYDSWNDPPVFQQGMLSNNQQRHKFRAHDIAMFWKG